MTHSRGSIILNIKVAIKVAVKEVLDSYEALLPHFLILTGN